MKIGIFGSYNRLNFGDDLLAYYISHVLSYKHQVTVLSDRIELVLPNGVERISKISDFVLNSDILVLGGGGFLTSIPDVQLEEQILAILEISLDNEIPLYILSIGGDQKNATEVWNYLGDGRKKLFKYPFLKKCIVRTNEEFCLNDSRFEFHEDVLWNCIEDLCPHSKNKSKSYTIGIHLSSLPVLRIVTALAELLSFITFRRVRFVYFKTHDPMINQLDELGAFFPFHNKSIQHTGNVLPFIQELKEVDILVSAKMHIGLLCLSMGKPFISFGGPIKALNLLKKLDLECCIYPSSPRKLFCFFSRVLFDKTMRYNYRDLGRGILSHVNEIKDNSRHNFDVINSHGK